MRAALLLLAACTPADKNANRHDVQEFVRVAEKNGHLVVLEGDTIKAFRCTSMPRHFPPIPVDMTLECIDGGRTMWKREGPRSDREAPPTAAESDYVQRLRAAGHAPRERAGDIFINADCPKVRAAFDAELRPPAGVAVVCERGFDGEMWRVKR